MESYSWKFPGEVIGINTLVVGEGVGFAIPANTARVVAEQTMQKGYVSCPYLGVRWQMVTPQVAAIDNLPVEWGVFVSEVAASSPANRAGILTRIGETTLDESHSYLNALFVYKPGDPVEVELVRDGKKVQMQVVLEKQSTR